MTIEFRPLTKAEAQSPVHLCGRCETWQKRFEIHHCVATERWKAAKAAMREVAPLPLAVPLEAGAEPVEIEANADENP